MTTRLRRRRALAASLLVLLVLGAAWALELARLARSVGVHAEYWALPRGEPGGLLYVAIGDSAAQGIGASSPERGYVSLLAQRLRNATGRPVQVVNLSRSGARIRDVLGAQVPALGRLGRVPDVLTVAIGGNDVRAYDRQTFSPEVQRLARVLPKGAYLADVPYFMHGRWEKDAREAAGLLRRAAAEHGLRPVALHEALQAEGWKAMLTQFAADWFHPNDRGHLVWADAFWREMSRDASAQRFGVTGCGALRSEACARRAAIFTTPTRSLGRTRRSWSSSAACRSGAPCREDGAGRGTFGPAADKAPARHWQT